MNMYTISFVNRVAKGALNEQMAYNDYVYVID